MSAPTIIGEGSATGARATGARATGARATRSWSYRSARSGHEVVVTTPEASPSLWADYLARAERTYAAHGVAGALDLDRIRDGRTTALFFAGLAPDGELVGGTRAQGPYLSPEQAHALSEWEDDPGRPVVRDMIAARLPFGVVEARATWVERGHPERRELVACLARAPLHAATILGARFALATSAVHALPMWTASGAVAAPEVSTIGYPDDRYRTALVWWDRWAPPDGAAETERRTLDLETAQLLSPVVGTGWR